MIEEPANELTVRIATVLGVDEEKAAAIIRAFVRFVVEPLQRKFTDLTAHALAQRNPFVYAVLGASDIETWVPRAASDILTSSAEGVVGNWLEEVARIVSGGFKPGSGVDLQRELPDGTIELYAIQSTTNTKNAGGRRSDVAGLKAAAGALRAQRRHVDLYIGYLFRRKRTTVKDSVTRLATKEFWEKMTGDPSFLSRLLHTSALLGDTYRLQSVGIAGAPRLIAEAKELFGDGEGGIDREKVLYAPKPPQPRPAATKRPRARRSGTAETPPRQ
ncbi:MAG: PmeII family type II restriction endonuclease [Dehalococcoidia bacterium]